MPNPHRLSRALRIIGPLLCGSALIITIGCKAGEKLGPLCTRCPAPVKPTCTVNIGARNLNVLAMNGRIFVSERTDSNVVGGGWGPFRPAQGPVANPAIGFSSTGMPDCFDINELWLRRPGSNEVHRTILTPGNIPAPGGGTRPDGASWAFHVQDAFGAWAPQTGGSGSPNTQLATPGMWPAPPLMSVGELSPQVFGCATGRSDDGAVTTTFLVESISPEVSTRGVVPIQDLLNGDDRFVPNRPGPIVGPANPPTPAISGPGNPIREGAVMCAMTQQADDITTRTLHMLRKRGNELFHAAASNFGSVTQDSTTFNRFRAVSGWGDVLAVLGGDFGDLASAAMVGRGPTLHVFFVARKDDRSKLFHTSRFSDGSWAPARDVFAESGEGPGSSVNFNIAVGICPPLGASSWNDQETEIVVATERAGFVSVLSHVRSARDWGTGGPPRNYSPLRPVPFGSLQNTPFTVVGMSVSARPFSDGIASISSLDPSSATAGAGGPSIWTLSVSGSNFLAGSPGSMGSVVRWNGSDRTTTFVSPSLLRATIPAADRAAAGTAQITVFNPGPGGGTSNIVNFTIN